MKYTPTTKEPAARQEDSEWQKNDAVVIGAPIAYELAQKGYKTLTVDKLSDAGLGSAAASCAIVRTHYSTEDGVALVR